MTNISSGFFVKAGVIAATVAAIAIPGSAFAATYAYVNALGNVSTVVASDPTSAMMTAPNIATHSGVMLLVNPADGVVGDGVSGV